MTWRVRLLDGARREMRRAAANYESEREGLGDRFLDEVAAVRNQIAALPEVVSGGQRTRTTDRRSCPCSRSSCSFESTKRVEPW
jgi:hypothetical protein